MNHSENKKLKAKYLLIFMTALMSFLLGLVTGKMIFDLFTTLAIGYIILKKGDKLLLEEYYERRRKKLEELEIVRKASREVIQSGRLFGKERK
ncbi:MAG: hypothetical protein LBM95_01775 [Lactobacillales bacterium]|jgi:uncharacterized membrane protein|nr:hypothetical protein [Lactobacillales bacterium]